MKVCMYKRKTHIGVVKRFGVFFNESTIIDVNLIGEKFFEEKGNFDPKKNADLFFPTKISTFLKIYQEDSINKLKEVLELFIKFSKAGDITLKDGTHFSFDIHDDQKIKFDIPLDDIHLYRDFYVHERHVKKGFEKRGEEVPSEWYEMPVFYKGNTAGFISDEEIIPWPSYTDKLDYELELGLIISKDGKNIKEKDAHKHIFGFTIFNDISARDIQKKEMKVRLGPSKGKDFASVLGPVIITQDEIGDEPDLLMRAIINGEEWSKGRSSEANFSWKEMIEFASKEEWILATDFMGSGTVGTGCGLELDKWIQPGDKLELEIERIGRLTNIIGTKKE